MKNLMVITGLIALAWVSVSSAAPGLPISTLAQKVRLGETSLTNRAGGDYIQVQGGAVCGLTHFQIAIRKDGALINDLKVVFGNNEVQDIQVRTRFEAGTESRWVDLDGNQRCIKAVIVYGQSFQRTDQSAKVVLFGLKGGAAGNEDTILLGTTRMGNQRSGDRINLPQMVCGLTKFKIKVKQDEARIDYLAVQFGNGQTQQINVRQNFAPGSESNWKDLDGQQRCIRSITVFGQSAQGGGRSKVEFWGYKP